MARQPLRERKVRYLERRKSEWDRIHGLLLRQQIRFERGDYRKQLTEAELTKVSDLLFKAFDHGIEWLKGEVRIRGLPSLEERRRIYFQICKVLRKAGNRNPNAKAKKGARKVILRRKREPLDAELP